MVKIDKPIGEVLRDLRHKEEMDQVSVTQAAGLSVNSLPRIERGERLPSFETVKSLLKAMGYEMVIRRVS